jgi:hypothetical protein
MNTSEINNYLNTFNFDLRITRDARWIDQKCTPDVTCFLSDCVLNYASENPKQEYFTVNDIWNSEYFSSNVQAMWGKPDVNNPTAASEYDKFINQPLKMLSYAKVLSCVKRGATNHFKINDNMLLEYIATREQNTFEFLVLYIEKVLKDSGLYTSFEQFKFKCQNQTITMTDFYNFKTLYEDFILNNTPINNRVEIRRIFTKVLNPLAVKYRIQGTIKGRLSKDIIIYNELMYKRINWRDVLKSKGLTRQEFEETIIGNEQAEEYTNYLVTRAMNQIKRRYRDSELLDDWSFGDATQVHHIFMKSEFPQISFYLENLIKLTPTQHYTKAHPNNNTHIIDSDYQYHCLIAKSNSIELALSNNEDIYSIDNFVVVINTGLSTNMENPISIDSIRRYLAIAYDVN